jgi:hypothetical protein
MSDPQQKPKPNGVQNRIAWPFIVVMVPLVILAPIFAATRSPYADYVIPLVVVLFAVMAAAVLGYNKIHFGVWLPGKKDSN